MYLEPAASPQHQKKANDPHSKYESSTNADEHISIGASTNASSRLSSRQLNQKFKLSFNTVRQFS